MGFDSATLKKYIASGSFGFVFVSCNNLASTYSAIKISFPEYSPDPEEQAKEKKTILREYNTMVGKHHENIVQILSLSVHNFTQVHMEGFVSDIPFDDPVHDRIAMYTSRARRFKEIEGICIHMELCGGTLRQWLEQSHTLDEGLLDLQQGIIQGLVDGLKFLHQNKIIHRDLKPENVMFSRSPKNSDDPDPTLPIKIGDFGLCRKAHTEETMTSTLTSKQGTELYRAPEVDGRKYSLQADLFSLGLIIWEVAQLIQGKDRKTLFDELVYDKEESLIKSHFRILNLRKVVTTLTKRTVKERLKSVDLLELIIARLLEEPIFKFACPIVKILESVEIVKLSDPTLSLRNSIRGAKDSVVLGLCLATAIKGDVIELLPVIYEGTFLLKQTNVTIIGTCTEQPLTNSSLNSGGIALFISGNHCTVRNLHLRKCGDEQDNYGIVVTGFGNILQNLHFDSVQKALSVSGHNNQISNCFIKDSQLGMSVRGNYNRIEDIQIQKMSGLGIALSGDRNIVSSLTFTDVWTGVEVYGRNNRITNFQFRGKKGSLYSAGIYCGSGSGNFVDSFKSEGFGRLYLASESINATVRNSVCGYLFISGRCHKLMNVDACKDISISGSGHRFQSCTTMIWHKKGKDVCYIDCL